MLLSDINHTLTLSSVARWGISEEELKQFDDIKALRLHIKRLNIKKQNFNIQKRAAERYRVDPEFREKLKELNRKYYSQNREKVIKSVSNRQLEKKLSKPPAKRGRPPKSRVMPEIDKSAIIQS